MAKQSAKLTKRKEDNVRSNYNGSNTKALLQAGTQQVHYLDSIVFALPFAPENLFS